jgi:hypothetical protein
MKDMSMAIKVSSIHLLYSIIKRTLLKLVFTLHLHHQAHRFHAYVSEGVQKA